jgi:hypothetical protein
MLRPCRLQPAACILATSSTPPSDSHPQTPSCASTPPFLSLRQRGRQHWAEARKGPEHKLSSLQAPQTFTSPSRGNLTQIWLHTRSPMHGGPLSPRRVAKSHFAPVCELRYLHGVSNGEARLLVDAHDHNLSSLCKVMPGMIEVRHLPDRLNRTQFAPDLIQAVHFSTAIHVTAWPDSGQAFRIRCTCKYCLT